MSRQGHQYSVMIRDAGQLTRKYISGLSSKKSAIATGKSMVDALVLDDAATAAVRANAGSEKSSPEVWGASIKSSKNRARS